MSATAVSLAVREETGEGNYRFVCPQCEQVVVKPADRKIVTLLLSAGVDVEQAQPDPDHLEARPDGPPLTLDDLIDLHFLLGSDDWVDRLLATAP